MGYTIYEYFSIKFISFIFVHWERETKLKLGSWQIHCWRWLFLQNNVGMLDVVSEPLTPAPAADIFEFKANLVYIASSSETVSKKKLA